MLEPSYRDFQRLHPAQDHGRHSSSKGLRLQKLSTSWLSFHPAARFWAFPVKRHTPAAIHSLTLWLRKHNAVADDIISILWTSQPGLVMAPCTRYFNTERHGRGIMDVTNQDDFLPWADIWTIKTDHAVILRTLTH